MLDYIANCFLIFSDDFIIIPLFILGFIWYDRTIFYHVACLILLSILLNVALKVSFQVPLSPLLNKKGFAFPSGHMQLVTVFYGWLAYQIKNKWLTSLIIVLLIGIAFSLVHFNYHNYYDIIGGVIVAVLLLSFYLIALLKVPQKLPWFCLALATLLMIYIAFYYGQIEFYVWTAYYTLCGFVVAEKIAGKKMIEMLRAHKLLATLLCFLIVGLIHTFFRYEVGPYYAVYIYELQWLLIGFFIPFSTLCAIKLICSKTK